MTKKQLIEISKIGIPSEELYHLVCNELLEYKDLEEEIGCNLDVIAKLRETRTCYTYTSMASSDVETLTKCDVLGLDICDTLFMVGYDIDGGYVCDHELKFNEYGIKWWLEPRVLPKYRKVEE